MGFVQETQSNFIVRIDFDAVPDDLVKNIFNNVNKIEHFNEDVAKTLLTGSSNNIGSGSVDLNTAVTTLVDSSTLATGFTTADGTANEFMKAFLSAISMNEGQSSSNSRTFAIAKQVGTGQSATAFTDVEFVEELEKVLGLSSSGLKDDGDKVSDDPDVNFVRNLLEQLQSASGGSVFDLNAMSQLVVSPADEYGSALESLRAISGTASLGISELTSKTTDVQVAQGKLEMVNGVIKNAINYLNQRARALTQ